MVPESIITGHWLQTVSYTHLDVYKRQVAEKEYGVRKEHRDIEKDAITKAK